MSAKIHKMLEELERAAEQIGVEVSYEKMTGLCAGRGGLCTVRGKPRIIMDKKATPQERLDGMLEALCQFDLDELYLSPRTREALEWCRSSGPREARQKAKKRRSPSR
jgi:hypothetical protein